mgnify:CR=1 FL=1
MGYENVDVLAGDWRDAFRERGPFDLVFFDGGTNDALQSANWLAVANLVRPSGMMVLDDLTPEELWPEGWRGKPDPKRDFAFRSGLFAASELRTGGNASLLLMVRTDRAEAAGLA